MPSKSPEQLFTFYRTAIHLILEHVYAFIIFLFFTMV